MRVTSILFTLLSITGLTVAGHDRVCRAIPDTSSWPSTRKWASLNNTVEGRLISTVPLAAPCHLTFNNQSTYNKEECDKIIAGWSTESIHIQDPSSVFWDVWTNNTCIPTTDPTQPCTIGTYPKYVIDAASVKHVQAGVKFARENNIRLYLYNSLYSIDCTDPFPV